IKNLLLSRHVSLCWGQDRVEQPLGEMTAIKGDLVTLQCSFSATTTNAYLYWYKQLPNRSPTFILSEFTIGKGTTEDEFKERFYATLDSTSRTVPLTIKNLHVSDSAVYYCCETAETHINTDLQLRAETTLTHT
uniref:Ig-like domain-containing protein n=1 Tax=Cyprinus carpio TaxID=7962 RepID=A0A8C1LXQ2_CYPCA